MRYVALFAIAIIFTLHNAEAQQKNIKKLVNNPHLSSKGLAPFRNELISYNIRAIAEKGDRTKAEHYKVLEMSEHSVTNASSLLSTTVNIPYMWLDRDVFLQIEGIASFSLSINNKSIGYSSDSRCPSQFDISKYITDGDNSIAITITNDGLGNHMDGAYISGKPEVFIYSQPKLKIEDYKITTTPDTTNTNTIFKFKVAVSNSYNSDELMSVGYDIYSPSGKLLNYDMREVALSGLGRDTITFQHIEYNTIATQWSEKSPSLYKVMLSVKYNGRLIEYIPLKVGISDITYNNGVISRNGKPIKIKPTNYNSANTETETRVDIKALKKQGFNTIIVDYPQDWWFYDICDELGVNVIDQANINNTTNANNRDINGTISNNPEWVDHFTERTIRAIKRNNNRASIVAFSLAGSVGNGYNLYKSYQAAKLIEQTRPIILRDNNGEWNSDMNLPN